MANLNLVYLVLLFSSRCNLIIVVSFRICVDIFIRVNQDSGLIVFAYSLLLYYHSEVPSE